jgi:hypothetical protein
MRIVCGRAITSIVCAGTIWGLFGQAAGAGEIKMARHPDYHQGKITFSYLGDIWLAQEDGSNPRRLTVHRAFDAHPRFSPDGKWIAFSSNRYGDYDVFVIPSEGGAARRLTYHSAPDTVVGWSRDSKRVMFSSLRGRVFPGIPSLYEVAVEGGLEEALPTDWAFLPRIPRTAASWHSIVIPCPGSASIIVAVTARTCGSWICTRARLTGWSTTTCQMIRGPTISGRCIARAKSTLFPIGE